MVDAAWGMMQPDPALPPGGAAAVARGSPGGVPNAGAAAPPPACRVSAHSAPPLPADADDACCWICLSDAGDGPLVQPCACPRFTHQACLARWQLVSAGKK